MKKLLYLIVSCLFITGMLTPADTWADRESRTTPLVRAVEEVAPAVVSISTISHNSAPQMFSTGDPMMDEFFNNMFPPRRSQRGGLGTGVVVDGEKGIIVTNSHVVRGASTISVQLDDRRQFNARLLGQDTDNDIAVLKVDSALPQARLGDSDDIMIGEQVLAIGNPYGFSHTVTVGVVSALNRRIKTGPDTYMSGLVQTDASINPGNSGGPLLNIDGEIIGINTMILRSGQGIGFAIPINKVVRVAGVLGSPNPPVWLGFVLGDSEMKDSPQEFNLGISALSPDSPAGRAGLERGDIVLALDDWALHSLPDYSLALKSMRPGQQVKLRLYRQNKGVFEQSVTLEKFDMEQARELLRLRTGLSISPNPQRNGGFKITRVELANSGIRPNDLVGAIGETSLNTSQDLIDAMAGQQGQGQIKIMLLRGNMMRWLAF